MSSLDALFFICSPLVFTSYFFAFRNRCADSKGTKMHIFFSENSMHGKHVNIFLVTFIYFQDGCFLGVSETEWGGLNIKHMYWQVCRHLLELSPHMLNNGLFLLCAFGKAQNLCLLKSRKHVSLSELFTCLRL